MPLCWVDIDLGAIDNNVRQLRAIVGPQSQLLAVVKSNAYGHGLLPVARTALSAGASWLGVISGEEALALRHGGLVAPIFVMGPVLGEEIDDLLGAGDIRFPIFDTAFARVLSQRAGELGAVARIHVEVDTGLGRLSVSERQAVAFVQEVAALPHLCLEGLHSHLADAEGMDQSYTMRQFAAFKRIGNELEQAGLRIPLRHLAASAASMLLPELRCDLVRTGISMYGYWPAEETKLLIASREQNLLAVVNDAEAQARGVDSLFALLQPALSWKAQLVQVKEVPAQSAVGYGCTFKTLRPTQVGVVSVGYTDGFDRHLSNNGHVLVRGHRAPIIGRICMNLCMIDVTDIESAQAGDEVVLIGRQGGQHISAEEMATRIGTIHYEVITRINWSLPRVYHKPPQPPESTLSRQAASAPRAQP